MPVIFEVLQYTLKEGTGHQFHSVMLNESIPLHVECGLEVVNFGNSLDDSDKYFLIRSFSDIDTMKQKLESFYASDKWRNGPRAAIVDMIEQSHRVLVDEFNF